jgi:hypothetical protein
MRRRRSAGLTYFFRPRGVVADLRDVLDFFDETEDRFDVVPFLVLDEDFLPDGCAGFWALCAVGLVEPEALEPC